VKKSVDSRLPHFRKVAKLHKWSISAELIALNFRPVGTGGCKDSRNHHSGHFIYTGRFIEQLPMEAFDVR